jgi:hypothetical protein
MIVSSIEILELVGSESKFLVSARDRAAILIAIVGTVSGGPSFRRSRA